MTAWVVACASLAIHHQFSNGSYLYLPAMAILRGRLATAVPGLVTEAWGRVVVVTIAVTIVAAAHRSARSGVERRRLFQVVRALGALAALAVLASFVSKWHWVAVARHVAWMTWYATPVGLAVLTAGLGFGSLRWLRSGVEPGARLGLALLVGPAFCYLVNPMVTRTQPWAVRRFIPMIFPLFLLLSLLGCWALVVWLARGRPRLAAVAYGGLVVGIAATFYSLSARVVLPGAVMPVHEQLRHLAQTIPERALVLVAEQDGWLHLQTAVQYVLRRDTLVLPLASGSDPRDDLIVSSYLGRQLAKGRRLVLLLAQDETRAGSLLRSYALGFRGSGSLEYVTLPWGRKERFPPRMSLGRLGYRVYELRPVAHAPGWREIRIGDVERDAAVVMEGFHAAEIFVAREGEAGGQPFRWTGPLARLALPPVEEVRLVLDTWRPSSTPAARVEIDVDGIPLGEIAGTRQGRRCLRLQLPREPVAVNRLLTLRTNTFEMRAPQRPARTRELGVRVFSVSIDGPGASAATDEHDESCASPQEPSPARHVADGAGPGLDRAEERTKIFR